MSKAHYPYPDDEFDAPVDPDGPHGVHRAPRSAWSRWWPFVLVIVIVPVVTFGAVYWFMGDRTSGSPGAASTTTPAAGTTPLETTEPPADTTTDEATTPAATQGPDLASPVEVINASGGSGQAAKAKDKLTPAGLTNVTLGNATSSLAADTVFYSSDGLKPTADLVASTLGAKTVLDPALGGAQVTGCKHTDNSACVSQGIRVVIVTKS